MFLIEFKFNLRMSVTLFRLSNNYMSSLRTTTGDALFVPSDVHFCISATPLEPQPVTLCLYPVMYSQTCINGHLDIA